jgi:hypothetical protein
MIIIGDIMIKSHPNRIALSAVNESRLRAKLRRRCCSEPWVDDQIRTVTDRSPEGEQIVYRFFNPHVFPPGGHASGMRWCRACGRFTPGPAVHLVESRERRFGPVVYATLVCDDCRIGDDAERYRELYEAGLHLRPAGSKSCVSAGEVGKEK